MLYWIHYVICTWSAGAQKALYCLYNDYIHVKSWLQNLNKTLRFRDCRQGKVCDITAFICYNIYYFILYIQSNKRSATMLQYW